MMGAAYKSHASDRNRSTLNDSAALCETLMPVRCADGYREGTKSIRRCNYRKQLDLDTLVWTRVAKSGTPEHPKDCKAFWQDGPTMIEVGARRSSEPSSMCLLLSFISVLTTDLHCDSCGRPRATVAQSSIWPKRKSATGGRPWRKDS